MTWTLKIRRMPSGLILAEYLCPDQAHGRFDALVDRDENGDPPGHQRCPVTDSDPESAAWTGGHRCNLPSDLVISAPRIKHPAFSSVTRGRSDPSPFATALDTTALGEGRETLQEFRDRRAKIWAAHDADNDPDRPRKAYSGGGT